MVGDRDDGPGVGLTGHELQDFAALIVDTDDTGCVEAVVLEVSKQRVDGRRPWTCAAVDGIADSDGVIQIAAEAPLVVHPRKVRGLNAPDPLFAGLDLKPLYPFMI
jgi:hypothetical protein